MKGDSLGALFASVHCEVAVVVAIAVVDVAHDVGELPDPALLPGHLTAIEKHALPPGMPVHVNNHPDFVFLVPLDDLLFEIKDLLM